MTGEVDGIRRMNDGPHSQGEPVPILGSNSQKHQNQVPCISCINQCLHEPQRGKAVCGDAEILMSEAEKFHECYHDMTRQVLVMYRNGHTELC